MLSRQRCLYVSLRLMSFCAYPPPRPKKHIMIRGADVPAPCYAYAEVSRCPSEYAELKRSKSKLRISRGYAPCLPVPRTSSSQQHAVYPDSCSLLTPHLYRPTSRCAVRSESATWILQTPNPLRRQRRCKDGCSQSAVALLLPSRLTVVGMLAISLFEGAKVCSVS